MHLFAAMLDLIDLELELELVKIFEVRTEPLHEKLGAPRRFPPLTWDRRIGTIRYGTPLIAKLALR